MLNVLINALLQSLPELLEEERLLLKERGNLKDVWFLLVLVSLFSVFLDPLAWRYISYLLFFVLSRKWHPCISMLRNKEPTMKA